MENKAILKNNNYLTHKYYLKLQEAILKQMKNSIKKLQKKG
jgi:hypothetical protein